MAYYKELLPLLLSTNSKVSFWYQSSFLFFKHLRHWSSADLTEVIWATEGKSPSFGLKKGRSWNLNRLSGEVNDVNCFTSKSHPAEQKWIWEEDVLEVHPPFVLHTEHPSDSVSREQAPQWQRGQTEINEAKCWAGLVCTQWESEMRSEEMTGSYIRLTHTAMQRLVSLSVY